jgi:hypothetical protein
MTTTRAPSDVDSTLSTMDTTMTMTTPSLDLQRVQFTVDQAANHAHLSTKTIRRYIRSQRLPAAVGADGAYVIDQGDLERVMRGEGQAAEQVDAPPPPYLARLNVADQLGASIAHALTESLAVPLLDRLEAQAMRIGQLEADLARATAPRPPRPPRPARPPRLSVPADPQQALEVLVRRYGAAEIARLASRFAES